MNDESEFAVPYQERLQGFANYPLLRSSEVLFRCFDVENWTIPVYLYHAQCRVF